MKTIFALVFCCVVAVECGKFSKEEAMEALKGLSKQCMDDTQSTQADFDDLISLDSNPRYEGKCLRKCLMSKFETMTDDGTLNVKRMVELTNKFTENAERVKQAEEIGNACSSAAAGVTDLCEAAGLYDQCIKNEIKTRHIEIQY